ncbi:MAG: hypothetical protein QOJ32_1115 [Frankiaceae bacterium]|nr:hypothetical protein [Frankiaceae bacterium]
MVDALRVQRLLRGVADRVAQLQGEAGADDERRADPLWLPGVKYLFLTAIEACIDAAQHVCASEGWGPPETNGEAFVLLGRHGALPPALAGRLRQAAGFRNVLVHDYVTVDDSVVVARLTDLSDLDAFVSAVVKLTQDLP